MSAQQSPWKWQDSADCHGANPSLFHPEGNPAEIAAQEDAAKDVCRGCEVRVACLAYALDLGAADAQGVWGGTNEAERKALAVGQRKAYLARVDAQRATAQRLAAAGTPAKAIALQMGVTPRSAHRWLATETAAS